MSAEATETRFRTHPLTSWGFAAVTSAIVLSYLISLATRTGSINGSEYLIPFLIVPMLMACAVWLAVRPSYTVAVDYRNNTLSAVQTWPVQKLLNSVTISDIASIKVLDLSPREGAAYCVIAKTKAGAEFPLTAELVNQTRAHDLAQSIALAIKR